MAKVLIEKCQMSTPHQNLVRGSRPDPNLTKKTLSLLLSGKTRLAKKYAGKHVLVVKNKVVPLKEKEEDIWRDIQRLKKEYGEMPTLTFVPRRDISYILIGAKFQCGFGIG